MNVFSKIVLIIDRASKETQKKILLLFILLFLFLIIVTVLTVYFSKLYPILLGLVFLSFGLGLRHAVDADHIAAIDNTTRKFMHERKNPVFVGFFFSLGHSTIVILLSLLLIFSTKFVQANIPYLQQIGALLGTFVSSFFLLLIGVINLFIFLEIFHSFVHVVKTKSPLFAHAHTYVHTSGLFMRIFTPLTKAIAKDWHMYFLGFLFGLGFDTASEIALLTLSATALDKLSIFAIVLLPLSFTAGMAFIDSLDGVLMIGAYGWAFIKPIRKLYYNLTITCISVFIALFIGSVEALQLFGQLFKIKNGLFSAIYAMSISNLGFFIIAVFLLSWVISLLLYKIKKYDQLPIS